MRTLHELPRFRDRWSYLYLEMGRLDVDADGLGFHQGDSVVPVSEQVREYSDEGHR